MMEKEALPVAGPSLVDHYEIVPACAHIQGNGTTGEILVSNTDMVFLVV